MPNNINKPSVHRTTPSKETSQQTTASSGPSSSNNTTSYFKCSKSKIRKSNYVDLTQDVPHEKPGQIAHFCLQDKQIWACNCGIIKNQSNRQCVVRLYLAFCLLLLFSNIRHKFAALPAVLTHHPTHLMCHRDPCYFDTF
eukprot:151804_1